MRGSLNSELYKTSYRKWSLKVARICRNMEVGKQCSIRIETCLPRSNLEGTATKWKHLLRLFLEIYTSHGTTSPVEPLATGRTVWVRFSLGTGILIFAVTVSTSPVGHIERVSGSFARGHFRTLLPARHQFTLKLKRRCHAGHRLGWSRQRSFLQTNSAITSRVQLDMKCVGKLCICERLSNTIRENGV